MRLRMRVIGTRSSPSAFTDGTVAGAAAGTSVGRDGRAGSGAAAAGGCPLEVREDVLLGQPPALARGRDARRVELVLGRSAGGPPG